MLVRSVVSFILLWGVLHCLVQATLSASWKERIKVEKSLLYTGLLATIVAVGLALVVQIF